MARSDAAKALGPALFDHDWSRVSGSRQGLARNAPMVRAARGYFNHRRLLEPIGNIAEAEENYCAQIREFDMVA